MTGFLYKNDLCLILHQIEGLFLCKVILNIILRQIVNILGWGWPTGPLVPPPNLAYFFVVQLSCFPVFHVTCGISLKT